MRGRSGPSGARALVLVVAVMLAATRARANVAEPDARAHDAFDFMNFLARRGRHDLHDERWNVYGHLTWISSFKPAFPAAYTNYGGSSNSLLPRFEASWTGTVTLYFGLRLWRGAEIYWAPEAITERPFSTLLGLGSAIQNFELQKQGSEIPVVYSSRLFLRQTIALGGEREEKTSDPLQLGTTVTRRRLVFTIGNFSTLDFFDRNSYSGDLRRQLFNMAFLSNAAFDFAADARGYTWGAMAELYFDDWAVRFAHTIAAKDPNQLPLDFRFWEFYGQQIELEHAHSIRGQRGVVRVLGFRNRERMGRFDDAIDAFLANPDENAANCTGFHYGSQNPNAPDLCWVRRPNVKWGVGVNVEQSVSRNLGAFLRAMVSSGTTEVYSYTSADRSLSFGVLGRGTRWGRSRDYLGVGIGLGFISKIHARYLALGGVDGFVGDGRLTKATETVFEGFYGVNLSSSVWVSADYQFILHPAFNADRGPVNVFGARFHVEF